jgi:hypothetical protein
MGLVGKLVHEDTSSLKEGEPSFASMADKIAHQQKLDCYCLVIELLLSHSPYIFNYIYSLFNFI